MSEDLIIQVQIDSRPAEAGRDGVIRSLAEIRAAVELNNRAFTSVGSSGAEAFEQLRAAAERQLAVLMGNRREYDLLQGALRGVTKEQTDYVRGIQTETEAQRALQNAQKDAAQQREIMQKRDIELNEQRWAQEKDLRVIGEGRDMHQQNQRWADETGKQTGGVAPLVSPKQSPFGALSIPDPDEIKMRTATLRSAFAEIKEMHVAGLVPVEQYTHAQRNMNNEINRLNGIADVGERSGFRRISRAIASMSFELTGAVFGLTAVAGILGGPAFAGVSFLKNIEEIENGMAGVLRSVGQIDGAVMSSEQAMAAAQSITARLRVDSLKYGISLEELVAASRVAIAPGLGAGMGIEEITKVAALSTIAVKNFGLDTRQVVQEIRALLTGSGNAASATVRTAMNITKEEMAAAKESVGGVYGFLMERMQGMTAAGENRLNTLSGSMDHMKNKAVQLFADPALFETVKTSVKELSSSIGEFNKSTGQLIFTEDALKFSREFLDTIKFLGSGLVGIVKTVFEFRTELALAAEAFIAFKVGATAIPLMVAGFGNLLEIAKALAALPAALAAVSTGAQAITGGALSSIDAFKSKINATTAATKGGLIGFALFGLYELANYTGIIDAVFNKYDNRMTSALQAADAAIQRGKDTKLAAEGGPNALERRNLEEIIADKTLKIAGLTRLIASVKPGAADAETGYAFGTIEAKQISALVKEVTVLEEKLSKLRKASGVTAEQADIPRIRGLNAGPPEKSAVSQVVGDSGGLKAAMGARLRAFEQFDDILNSKVSSSAEKASALRAKQVIEDAYQFQVQAIKKADKSTRLKFLPDVESDGQNYEDSQRPDSFRSRAQDFPVGPRAEDALDEQPFALIEDAVRSINKETATWLNSLTQTNSLVGDTAPLIADITEAEKTRQEVVTATVAVQEKSLAVTQQAQAEVLDIWQNRIKGAADGYAKSVMTANDLVARTTQKSLNTLENGLYNLFTKGKFQAKDFFRSIAEDITKLIIQQNLIKPIAEILSGGGKQAPGSGDTNWLGLALSAIGGLIGGSSSTTTAGGAIPNALGGGVYAGQELLVGELGPEKFVPQSNGYIVPNNILEAPKVGPTTNIEQTILNFSPVIDARGADAGVQARIDAALQKAKAETFEMVRQSLSRGGAMYKAAR